MDKSRRNLIKAGASAAVGSVLMASRSASAQETPGRQPVPAVPPLAAKIGLRLATGSIAGAAPTVLVVLDDSRVIDLKSEALRQGAYISFDASSMLALVASGNTGFAETKAIVDRAIQQSNLPTLAQVTLTSPIPRPQRNIFCVGWNYLDHFEEGKKARVDRVVEKLPDHPVFFSKATHTMNGPFDSIPHDITLSNTTDWEAELAVIIGQRGRNISEDKAMDYVFGYSVFNDTTSREVQQKLHGGQWFRGKSLDGHGPMGPWIVTTAGLKLDDVHVICRVNGVEKQHATYQQMYFKIPRIIAELSRGLTLEPGDIIATGTPSGVGFARRPPEFLHPGDVMETEVTGIGIIRNTIKAETV